MPGIGLAFPSPWVTPRALRGSKASGSKKQQRKLPVADESPLKKQSSPVPFIQSMGPGVLPGGRHPQRGFSRTKVLGPRGRSLPHLRKQQTTVWSRLPKVFLRGILHSYFNRQRKGGVPELKNGSVSHEIKFQLTSESDTKRENVRNEVAG